MSGLCKQMLLMVKLSSALLTSGGFFLCLLLPEQLCDFSFQSERLGVRSQSSTCSQGCLYELGGAPLTAEGSLMSLPLPDGAWRWSSLLDPRTKDNAPGVLCAVYPGC